MLSEKREFIIATDCVTVGTQYVSADSYRLICGDKRKLMSQWDGERH